MIDYLYDGTFEGVLTCVYHHYYTEEAAGISVKGEYQPSLLHDCMYVETDGAKASRVYEAIEKKINSYALKTVYRAYLSNDPHKEMKILRYLVLGFRNPYAAGHNRSDPAVFDMETLVKKVGFEKERMLEFVRFEAIKGDRADEGDDNDGGAGEMLYAEVEPDNDVLELIGDHFSDRFKNNPFIIRDLGRNKALIAYEGHWYISEGLPENLNPVRTEDEISYQRLWQTYFDHIAIKERVNPRCQRNFMPARYWKHLTEMNRK
ncbi:MAG: TIGR03915 family putative DNA repair protein [Eubacteriales bacterium]|nr:TIGR03915 family putative DNA repair protein [Eubacteriales bacterium]